MNEDYQRLGYKTLWLFIFERSTVALIALLIAVGMFILLGQDLPVNYSALGQPINIQQFVRYVAFISFSGFVIAFLLAILIGWLVYIHNEFRLGDHAIKIKRGILTKKEVAIPYQQIQNINIERDPSYQAFGLSRLVIETAGHDDKPGEESSEGVLPAIDKNLAEKIQAELLRRASAEKAIPTSSTSLT